MVKAVTSFHNRIERTDEEQMHNIVQSFEKRQTNCKSMEKIILDLLHLSTGSIWDALVHH